MVIQGIKLTGMHLAAIELIRRVHFTDTRLHNHYIGTGELRWFACSDYHSDLLPMGAICRWPFIYMCTRGFWVSIEALQIACFRLNYS